MVIGTPTSKRPVNVIALVVAVLGAGVLALACVAFPSSEGFGYDFRAYDSAARRLLDGLPIYLPDTAEAYAAGRFEGLFLYPPPVALGFVPLATLPQDSATVAWFVLRIALLGLGCLAMPVSPAARLATFGVGSISQPVLMDLNIGNVSVTIFAITALAWRLQERAASGLLYALLILLRIPFGAFVVLLLASMRTRALLAAAVTSLVVVVLSLPFVGIGSYGRYVELVLGLPDVSAGEHNFSFRSLAIALGLGPGFGLLLLLLGVAVAIVAIVVAARRRDASTAFVVTTVATLLAAPFLHPHYLVVLIIPAAFLFDRLSPAFAALPLVGWLPGNVLPPIALAVLAILLLPAVAARPIPPHRITIPTTQPA